jgi:hypothetical protein
MKQILKFSAYIFLSWMVIFSSCKKENYCIVCSDNVITGAPTSIQVKLIPIGNLSEPKSYFVAASAGNKIVFAGGWLQPGVGYSGTADIYDISTNTWSVARLSEEYRQGMVAASVENKIFFAGGGDNDFGYVTSRIDIYDVVSNRWSTAELSEPKEYLAAATIGNKVFFAGGGNWNGAYTGLSTVDIYDNATNSWTKTNLSQGRSNLSATAIGGKVYFAGGSTDAYERGSNNIDIFDTLTNTWTGSSLQELKNFHGSVAAGNKIYWAGGKYFKTNNTMTTSGQVEIRDVNTGVSSFHSIYPRSEFSVVVKGDYIVFFTGRYGEGTYFDVYNFSTDTWLSGQLPKKINDAAIISVNNTIYVAGGYVDGILSSQVWKLEF